MTDAARASTSGLFLAVLVGVGALEAQSGGRASLTAFGGFALGSHSALVVGAELRTPELGRLSAAVSTNAWQFLGVGCDLIIGPGCPGETAKAVEVGPVVRLSPAGLSWRLEGTARLGGLWYRDVDDGFWDPSVGVAFGFGTSQRLGGQIALRYHALTSSRSVFDEGDNDHVVVSGCSFASSSSGHEVHGRTPALKIHGQGHVLVGNQPPLVRPLKRPWRRLLRTDCPAAP